MVRAPDTSGSLHAAPYEDIEPGYGDDEPHAHGNAVSTSSSAFHIRPAIAPDGKGVASLFVQCAGGLADEHEEGFKRELSKERADNLVLVAEDEGMVVGFARARRHEPEPSPSTNGAPPGWYLLGVDVLPAYRRKGVGTELTRVRLRWIAERAVEAFYFTEKENRASIALHERFGFREVNRGVEFPGAHGAAESRVLFRVDL